eukprot:jgi/Mesen1/4148/ME000218S03260
MSLTASHSLLKAMKMVSLCAARTPCVIGTLSSASASHSISHAAKQVALPFRSASSLVLRPSFAGSKMAASTAHCVPTRHFVTRSIARAQYASKEEGDPSTKEYRLFFSDASGKQVSPWHDIPLRAGDGLYNMVCEIPKETSAKMEVATEEPSTPIRQDIKKGKLRFYPYNINWNYGLLPQTWEDPTHSNPEVENCFGDNDPVDVVDISETTAKRGEVYKVKPLAVLAMIDEGELDWKVVVIRADDPKAAAVDDLDSVEKEFPGTLTAIRDWFRDYKIPDGKPANRFGFDDKPAGKAYTIRIIEETNEAWAKLVKRSVPAGELSLV